MQSRYIITLCAMLLSAVPGLSRRGAVPAGSRQRQRPPHGTTGANQRGRLRHRQFSLRLRRDLAELRLHYTTLGAAHRDARGQVDNAVLMLHGRAVPS